MFTRVSKAIFNELRSIVESLPSLFRTSFFSNVDIAGLIIDGFSNPASCQFFTKLSPISNICLVLLVIARIMISRDDLL